MEKASRIMYKIANIFNWIELVCGIICIVAGIIVLTGAAASANVPAAFASLGKSGMLIVGIWMVIISVVLIVLTRLAYAKGSSKGWDILFIVFGVLNDNVFYILGGIFGLVARK
jgi:lysylphosphatidylglycerol synthetase-like protein (DUF2156 family)